MGHLYVLLVTIADSARACIRAFKILAYKVPEIWHYWQRCESHQANLITMRGFDVRDVVGSLYCMAKLLRVKAPPEASHAVLAWCL